MPFIEVKTSVELSKGLKEQLKSELGKAVTVIPGKTEAVTMVGIVGSYDLYFGGQRLEKSAYVEVKLFGETTLEAKQAMNTAVCELLQDILAIPINNVYLTFEEKKQWGAKGQLIGK